MRSHPGRALPRVILLVVATPGVHRRRRSAAGHRSRPPAQLDVRAAGEHSIRITLKPVGFAPAFPVNPAVVDRAYGAPAISLREVTRPVRKTIGALTVEVRPDPLALRVTNRTGALVQEIVFERDGTLSFRLDDRPVLGLGEGGPLPDKATPWREQPVQFDRRGRLDTMQPRWQADMYGSRNPVAMLLGTGGWACSSRRRGGRSICAAPTGVASSRGRRVTPNACRQNERNQQQALAKGLPPPDTVVPGLVDLFVFDAADPAAALATSRQSPARRRCRRCGPSGTCSRIARSRPTRRWSTSPTRSAASRSRSTR